MEYKIFKPAVLTTLLFMNLELCAASERRYINQLNSFKREVRDEFGFMNTDIDKLFKNLGEINTTLQLNKRTQTHYQKSGGSMDSTQRLVRNCPDNKEKNAMAEKCVRTNVDLLSAFESEKRLNRKLQTRLQAVENVISRIAKDMDIFKAFMEYINDALKERESAETKKKNGGSIAKGSVNGHNEFETTTIVAQTSTTVSTATSNVTGTTQNFCVDKNGVHVIYLESLGIEKSFYCDGNTDGGDCIVIMRRQDGSVDFDRKWRDYKYGFGNADGEFWIGNDDLHKLTKSKPMELRIDMEDYAGNKVFAKYKVFKVGSEAEKYVLTVTGYSGTAGDSMDKVEKAVGIQNGQKFTTTDSDNDKYDGTNCAQSYPGGWWFNKCFRSHLTGLYGKTTKRSYQGIIWHTWLGWSDYLKYVDMKIR